MKNMQIYLLLCCLICSSGLSKTGHADPVIPMMVGDITTVDTSYGETKTNSNAKSAPLNADSDRDGEADYRDAFPQDPKRSKSIAFCDTNRVTCDGHKGCQDRHIPDPRCPQLIEEPAASRHRLLGFDADRDGIRDDIEKQIDAAFSGIVNHLTREMAISYQKILSGALNNKQINQEVTEIERLNSCIRNATSSEAKTGHRFITHRQLNTIDRTRTYLQRTAEAYDTEGPPAVKDCNSGNKNSTTQLQRLEMPMFESWWRNSKAKRERRRLARKLTHTHLYFINGVMNNQREAKESKEKLRRLLYSTPITLLYNTNHLLLQFFDLWVHKSGEMIVDHGSTLRFWGFIYENLPSDSSLTNAFMKWYDPDRDIGYWAEKDLNKMIERVKWSLKQNKPVIIISHSEGNFFYRSIHKALVQWDAEKTQQCFAGVGIATPLSSKFGNYTYITSSNDKIINMARRLWGSTLNSNITIQDGFGGFLGHALQKTYLTHADSRRRLKNDIEWHANRLIQRCRGKGKSSVKGKRSVKGKSSIKGKTCGQPVAKAGGKGNHRYTYALKHTSPHKVEISFEAYNVPDNIKITANGKTIAKTDGLVKGFHQWEIDYDPKKHGTKFIAHIDAPKGGTAWKLCIDCEGSSCNGQIKRKKIGYSFSGAESTDYWTCSNYRIDGSPVQRWGTKKLSVGKHSFSANCWCKWGVSAGLCKSFFGTPWVNVSWSSASCGGRQECALNNKREVIVEVF